MVMTSGKRFYVYNEDFPIYVHCGFQYASYSLFTMFVAFSIVIIFISVYLKWPSFRDMTSVCTGISGYESMQRRFRWCYYKWGWLWVLVAEKMKDKAGVSWPFFYLSQNPSSITDADYTFLDLVNESQRVKAMKRAMLTHYSDVMKEGESLVPTDRSDHWLFQWADTEILSI